MALCSTAQCNCAIESSSLSITGNGSGVNPYVLEVATSIEDRLTDLETRGDEQTYNPALGGVGWSLGAGTVIGRYWEDGLDTGDLVTFRATLIFGAGFSLGAAGVIPTVTIPVPCKADHQNAPSIPSIRIFLLRASPTTALSGDAQITSSNLIRLLPGVTSGTYASHADVDATTPWAWNVGDRVDIFGKYPRA